MSFHRLESLQHGLAYCKEPGINALVDCCPLNWSLYGVTLIIRIYGIVPGYKLGCLFRIGASRITRIIFTFVPVTNLPTKGAVYLILRLRHPCKVETKPLRQD